MNSHIRSQPWNIETEPQKQKWKKWMSIQSQTLMESRKEQSHWRKSRCQRSSRPRFLQRSPASGAHSWELLTWTQKASKETLGFWRPWDWEKRLRGDSERGLVVGESKRPPCESEKWDAQTTTDGTVIALYTYQIDVGHVANRWVG